VRPKLSPMTYEEMIYEYNTQYRSDHSIRYIKDVPFDIIEMVDDHRQWPVEAVRGIRNTGGCVELALQYPGWPEPIWMDVSNRMNFWKNVRAFKVFEKEGGEPVQHILKGPTKAHFCLEGCSEEGPVFSDENEDWKPAALKQAQRRLQDMKERYAKDKSMNHFYPDKKQKPKRKMVGMEDEVDGDVEEEDEENEEDEADEEHEEHEEEGTRGGEKAKTAQKVKNVANDKKRCMVQSRSHVVRHEGGKRARKG